MRKILVSLIVVGSLFSCKSEKENSEEVSQTKADTLKKVNEGWKYLFDGENAEGWRAYNEDGELPAGWTVEEGTLKSLGKGGDIGGDIIYAEEKFGEFELALEWKIAPGGNSGIFYHVVEGEQYEAPYFTGPEYQIRDHKGNQQDSLHMLGADYGMYKPNYGKEVIKEAGKWNTSRIIFTENKVTYMLNGQKTVEFVPWSEDWKTRKSEGKWKEFPDYGEARTGYIGLQDHGSEIWYRNIKIKTL